MSIKPFNECDDCGERFKKIHFYKDKILCIKCYKRQFIIIHTHGIFDEPLEVGVSFSMTLTKSQKKILDKRVKYLFPDKSNCSRVKYLRALVLGDITHWEKERVKKIKGG